jgi:hypothetical protein
VPHDTNVRSCFVNMERKQPKLIFSIPSIQQEGLRNTRSSRKFVSRPRYTPLHSTRSMSASCSIHKTVITSSNTRLNVVPLLRRLLEYTIYILRHGRKFVRTMLKIPSACCTPTIRRLSRGILLKFGTALHKLRNPSFEYQERTMMVSMPIEGLCLT